MLHYASNLDPQIRLAFTTQAEGNLALHVNDDPHTVWENRARLEQRIGVRGFSLAFMNQVHSATVHEARPVQRSSWDEPAAPTCDGLLSPDGDQPLAVMVADCLPVLFVARDEANSRTSTAAVHAGRRGLLDGILSETVNQFRQRGAARIEAIIGPSICGRCYEVPEAMQAESEQLMPGISGTTSWNTPALDLPAAARRQLEDLGVAVRTADHCTLEDSRFFSYRRDPGTGRLAGLVWRD